jgi:hypothetical protein
MSPFTKTPASRFRSVVSAFSMPWSGFVAVFLYYVALALLLIGGFQISPFLVAVVYLLPVVGYVALLLNRGIHALVALPIEIGETPHALQH